MILRLMRLLQLNRRNDWRSFHTTGKLSAFYETDRKSGYPRISDYVEEEKGPFQRVREGFRQFREESALLWEEFKEQWRMDPELRIPPGEVDVHFKFNGDPKILEKFIVTADSDLSEGNSIASLELSPNGHGIFSGVIDTQPIKDGKAKAAGYCNVRTARPTKAFYRDSELDWSVYTHLIMRVRGDGRNYMINLYVNNTYDCLWNDIHNFVLYTRGGPYWQYVKIPFSKFFLSNRGRIQDHQGRIKTYHVTSVSITASDGIPGPFNLEIDFIGTERDEGFMEEFAYELYRPPHPYYV